MKRFLCFFMVVCVFGGTAFGVELSLKAAGTYSTGIFDDKAAQIVDYNRRTKWLYVTNCADETIDVLGIRSANDPKLLKKIALPGKPLSVAVHPICGLVAAAIEGEEVTDAGTVAFYGMTGIPLGSVAVGPLPDMLVWTPDGTKLVVANEGEPNDDYDVDPEGSVSIITLGADRHFAAKIANATVEMVGFDAVVPDSAVRVYGPDATFAQDAEPEYIAVSEDSKTAWVTLQENNAIAKLNIETAQFEWVRGLGYKDHLVLGNALDPSNKDDGIEIANWPVFGIYTPDAIAAFTVGEEQYLITANEGDARDYEGFSEEKRGGKLDFDPDAFAGWEDIQENENLGRLKFTNTMGDIDDDGDYDELYCFGGRSISIWNAEGELVSDTGDQFERITAAKYPDNFNATDDENNFDNRSDDKGPEPEHVVVGDVGGCKVAFVGLERIGGIMAYDVSDPEKPRFLDYVNNRDFSVPIWIEVTVIDPDTGEETEEEILNPEWEKAGDLSTEGLLFIPGSASSCPLLIAANEISGTVTIFEVQMR